ncbi:CPm [Raspberry leaf mottle virus]|uniref:CPm n=1 Tax=Raspberry leaf mottle virus TaxID=326941 RepID=A0MBW9_9CLOS|nr:CPm [Raspberry leaf mottle virus]ABC87280.1 CPm [Raspberry leaf mottle virus]QRG29099.1 CPm [Raspberry leaf mottle virus]
MTLVPVKVNDSPVSPADAAAIITSSRQDPTSFGGILARLNVASISETQTDRFSDKQLLEVITKLSSFLKETYHTLDKDLIIHITAIVKRAFTLSTSTKVKYSNTGCITYSLNDNTEYTLYDKDVFPFITNTFGGVDTPNAIRKFCCSFELCHTALANLKPSLYEGKRFTRLGTPKGKAYLGADFLTGTLPSYSEHDRAITLRCSETALTKTPGEDFAIVSLRDLGRRSLV